MPLAHPEHRAWRQSLLTLVEPPPSELEPPPAIGVPDLAASSADRMTIAALQATTKELHRLAADTEEALAALLAGRTAPSGGAIRPALRTIPRWHFAMLNDRVRNELFAHALQRCVRPGSHVLDIGSGTGLLAMLAVRAGAAHVTTCEANPILAELSRQIVAAHGMADVITVVARHSSDLVVGADMPAPADLIVSEIVDCGLVGEGLLPTIGHAREHLLAPGGELLPVRGRLIGCLVESDAITDLNRVTTAVDHDVRMLNRFSTPGHFPVRLETWPHRLLSEPVELVEFDLEHDPLEDGRTRRSLVAQDDGTAHGIVAWFELELCADVVLRNAPGTARSHWMQAFIPWIDPVDVTAGEPLVVDLDWSDAQLTAHSLVPTRPERTLP